MVRVTGRPSKAQKARNREASRLSLTSHGKQKTEPQASSSVSATAASLESLLKERNDARRKASALKAQVQASVRKASRDKHNAERRCHRLEAKLAERRINGTSSSSTSTPTPELPSMPTHSCLLRPVPHDAEPITMVLHISPFNSTPLSQHGVQDGLILVRQSELEDLRAGRRKLLQRVKRLQKQRSRDKAKLLRLRVQLEAQPLKRIFPFKTKCGVITEATRDMIRELVALGVPHRKIRHASEIVLAAAGFATEGNFDRHSVARIVREGYVAAAMHIMHEVSEAKCELLVLVLSVQRILT